MVRISREVPTPVQPAVVVPDREDVLATEGWGFYLAAEHLVHQGDEVFAWVAVNTDQLVALLEGEFFHQAFDYGVRVLVEFLEIVAEVSENVRAFQDTLQKAIFVLEVAEILLFGDAHILIDIIADKLVFKAMDSPPNMGRECPVDPSVC